MAKPKKFPIPKLAKGYERQFIRCRMRGCRRAYYYDFIPYSLASPVRATACGHSIGHRDLNVDEIDEATFHRVRLKEKAAK